VASGAVSEAYRRKETSTKQLRSDILIGTPQKKILRDRNGKKVEENECFYKRRTSDRNSGNKWMPVKTH
jgi:hypothetical protein